jgi:hypothetical protein
VILPDSGISVSITDLQVQDNKSNGGEGGIRTPGTLSGTPVFKTGAINHSATSPTCYKTILLRNNQTIGRRCRSNIAEFRSAIF